jgi:hypothetical protein
LIKPRYRGRTRRTSRDALHHRQSG